MKLLRRRTGFSLTNTIPEEHEVVKEEPKKKRKSMENTLPSDEYKDLLPPTEIKLTDQRSLKVSVLRGGEFGLPRVDIREFVYDSNYTGFTKRGITLDLDKLPELKAVLCDVIEDCDAKKLFDEFKD